MAVLNTATVPVIGNGTMEVTIVTKLEAAAWAGVRTFVYSASSYVVGAIGVAAATGTGGQTPNLTTIKAWGLGALFAGGTAVIAFVKNLSAPKTTVAK